VGDVEGTQPWAVQMEARAKWDAWNSVKGMSKEDAMKQYIDIVTQGDPNWRVSWHRCPPRHARMHAANCCCRPLPSATEVWNWPFTNCGTHICGRCAILLFAGSIRKAELLAASS
jgi:hypothetical protein